MANLNIYDGEDDAWSLPSDVNTQRLMYEFCLGGKHYMFKFYHEIDVEQVVNGAPWMFNNHLLVIHRLQENEDPIFCPIRLNQGSKELECGWDLLLKAQPRRATTMTSMWLQEGGDSEFPGGPAQVQMEHDLEESPLENIDGKKRSRLVRSGSNFYRISNLLEYNDERESSCFKQISMVASRQADRK
ncbi:hypothetical protein Godav_010134 [Gossypium davidsonii]|uniref:DUF4283 domain-containing protein n=1 Tax=Gossypium davidsonii TaxID=34287 RepID=A0A7J8SH78_GOSDV|nr:hypothetical protein [Gossypium davidsonii]